MFFGSKKANSSADTKKAADAPVTTAAPSMPAMNSAAPATTPAANAKDLPAEESRRRAGLAKQAAAAFGELVTLLMHAPSEKGRPLSDLEWMLMPAVATGQYVIADAQSKQTGAVMPVAGVIWALVSPEIDKQLSQNLEQAPVLKRQDWRSGDIPWVIMALGDQKVLGGLIQNLANTVFKDKPAKIRARGKDGKVIVGKLDASARKAAVS